jgi:ABC-type transport system involved in multi-copper enzyme maturation permease subunit
MTMNTTAMRWILWREYRLVRAMLIASAAAMIAPYLMTWMVNLWDDYPHYNFAMATLDGSVFGLGFSQIVFVLLGGVAFAGERSDRSAEFVAYLPISRRRRLWTKVAFALAAAVIVWSVYGAVNYFGREWVDGRRPDAIGVLSCIATTGLAFFGAAWLASSIPSQPAFAVAAGLACPLAVYLAVPLWAWYDGTIHVRAIDSILNEAVLAVLYGVACLALGVICFVWGNWRFLRRVEP